MPTSGSSLSFVTETGVDNGTAANPTHTTGSITSGDIVIAALGIEASAAITADTDTSNGTWSSAQAATGGATTSAQQIHTQYKVVTGTATQTYNVTIGANDWALSCVVLTETLNLPAAPTNLAGTAGVTSVALTWTAPAVVVPAVSDYAIQYQEQTSIDSDTFTGSNGAAWDASWGSTVTTQGNGGTGTATIESNQGRITTPGTGNFTRVFKKLVAASSGADQRIDGDVTVQTGEAYPLVVIRGTDPAVNGNGYAIQFDISTQVATISRYTTFVAATLGATISLGTVANGDVIHFKLQAVGTTISAKVWKNADPEPAWQDRTDATYATAGNIFIGGAEGTTATVRTWDFDNIACYDLNGAFTTWNPGVSTTASETVTGLTAGTPYAFKVAAINSNGTGPYSSLAGPYTPTAATGKGPPFSSPRVRPVLLRR
jgi:hypothetical protein